MKRLKNRMITTMFMLLIGNICIAQRDSIKVIELENRIEKSEGFQLNTEKALENKFTSLENKINDDNYFIKWALGLGLGINVVFIVGLLIGAKKYVRSKLNEKIDRIVSQQESNILEIIDKQDIEKQILKTKKILVLSSNNGDEVFLRKFFKIMGFQIDNISYKKVDDHKSFEDYDLLFVNNEDSLFDETLIQQYFENSKENAVLFFFGSRFNKGEKVASRMSFANSRTQLYGNLINLLKYQEVLK